MRHFKPRKAQESPGYLKLFRTLTLMLVVTVMLSGVIRDRACHLLWFHDPELMIAAEK